MSLALAYQARISLERRQPSTNAYLLNVDFESRGGEEWSAVGGGETLAEAIAAAREALPGDRHWNVTRWNHLYGD